MTNLSEITKNISLANRNHLCQLKERLVFIKFFISFCHSRAFQSQKDDSDDSESSSSSSDEEGFADELNRYLSSGRIKGVDDPVKWWHENQASYPRLSRMAKDFLTIPGKLLISHYKLQ